VVAGYASAASPTVAGAVAALRAGGAERVAVAAYLIASGQFHDLAAAAGGDLVAAPLADHDALARLVLHRYDGARGSHAPPVSGSFIARSLITQVSPFVP
jgi:sirohydrochlorin ferrochelatase